VLFLAHLLSFKMFFAARSVNSLSKLSYNFRQFSSFSSAVSITDDVKAARNQDRREQVRNVHSTKPLSAETAAPAAQTTEEKGTSFGDTIASRFAVTAEVTVSKIFPAGFGWQSSSILAENMGFTPESMNFAFTTGLGDGIGVFLGHTAYFSAKKALTGSDINMTREKDIGILLGSAAFCSGTAWQPLVNALQGANLTFNEVFFGTWIGCGAAFYTGLRVGRTILSGFLEHVQEPTFENGKNDVSLSVAIGGATGFFVGTDAAYLPDQNFLIDVVGIKDGTPDLAGCAIAGTSTAMGFVTAQTVENFVFPAGKCWND